jgi:hypothetical protein
MDSVPYFSVYELSALQLSGGPEGRSVSHRALRAVTRPNLCKEVILAPHTSWEPGETQAVWVLKLIQFKKKKASEAST